jgi:hypothetical protein
MSTEPEPEAGAAAEGLYLYAVVRARGRRFLARGEPEDVIRVRYRELEALVRAVPYQEPGIEPEQVEEHQRVVDRAMHQTTVLPVPCGIVFRGRRALLRFLEDQYIVLDEGLSWLDGHWEMRLHITGDPDVAALEEVANELYGELRRFARAAIPLPRDGDRVLSAAFLVDRGDWVRFVEQAHDLNRAHPELAVDLTGPWPPYDFVTLQR